MFIITKNGKKINIDDKELDEFGSHQQVGLFTDNVKLKTIWIMELNKITFDSGRGNKPIQYREDEIDIRFDHEPTENEILYNMSRYNMLNEDFVTIRKAYVFGYKD